MVESMHAFEGRAAIEGQEAGSRPCSQKSTIEQWSMIDPNAYSNRQPLAADRETYEFISQYGFHIVSDSKESP